MERVPGSSASKPELNHAERSREVARAEAVEESRELLTNKLPENFSELTAKEQWEKMVVALKALLAERDVTVPDSNEAADNSQRDIVEALAYMLKTAELELIHAGLQEADETTDEEKAA